MTANMQSTIENKGTVALVDSSTLLGREIKEVLEVRGLSRDRLRLLETPGWAVALLGLSTVLMAAGCGYRVSVGASRVLPPAVRIIAVPVFQNETLGFKIEQKLTQAVHQAFLLRTPYKVQSVTAGSDAVLHGAVTGFYTSPVAFDPANGRTTEVLITVGLSVRMTDTSDGQVLFEAGNLVYRESYEVGQDTETYIGENLPALDRLSRRVAARLIASLMEGVE